MLAILALAPVCANAQDGGSDEWQFAATLYLEYEFDANFSDVNFSGPAFGATFRW